MNISQRDHSEKSTISIRIDNDLLDYCKLHGCKGYQSRLNAYLRAGIEQEKLAEEQLKLQQDRIENMDEYDHFLAEYSNIGC